MQQPAPDGDIARRIELLQKVALFADLHDQALEKLAQDFRLKTYGKNDVVFHQDDPGHEIYVILDGRVRVFKISPSGDETTLVIFSKYDVFGEFAVLDGGTRSATARAIGHTALLAMSQDRFDFYMRSVPGLARGMTKVLTAKLRWTAAYAAAVAQYDAAARLLHIILLYNGKFGEEQEEGIRYELDLSLNQGELASLVGARREWVNRLLRDWRKRGLLEYDAGKIIILNLPGVVAERDRRVQGSRSVW
jgi:CRP-like cAMP-binding protein